ncbi:MAG: TonB C-terminal domain-containing protein [Acidobacteriia bacterium]|nr:TonB C-terminal domain-containing protein [Terriglobia bacterium]
MPVSADIFFEREEWKRPLAWSVILHSVLFGGMFFYTVLFVGSRAETWGGTGGGGAIHATLVNSIPLPASQVQTQNIVAHDSKGLTQSLPRTKEEAPEAIPIPERETKRRPGPQRSTTARKIEPPKENIAPFGQGGPVSGPYGVFQSGGAKGGFGFTGGGGDFGSRYAWYVDAVRRKVSENWMKYEIDPSITAARRVYITFDILRDGSATNIELEQSSGIPSLDQSAVRALQRIETFGPLPPDYSGSRVSVEFWFDYRR